MTIDNLNTPIECSQCSEANPATARFCRNCGAALNAVEALPNATTQHLIRPDTGYLPVGEFVPGPDGADLYVVTASGQTHTPRCYTADALMGGVRVLLHEGVHPDDLKGIQKLAALEKPIHYVAALEPAFTITLFGATRYYVPEVIAENRSDSPRHLDEWTESARQLVYALAELHETAGLALNLTPETCASHITISKGVASFSHLGNLVLLDDKPDAAVNDMRALAGYLRQYLSGVPTLRAHLDKAAHGALSAVELARLVGQPQRGITPDEAAMSLRVDIGQATDKGMHREANEDNCAVVLGDDMLNKVRLLIVADGMGGEEAGEVAAELTVRTLSHSFHEQQSWGVKQTSHWIQQVLKQTNEAVLAEAQERHNQMGATVALALIHGNKVHVAHVGDCRVYRWNPVFDSGKITRLTRDHSLVQRLVDLGQITDEQRYTHPERNMVLRSVGDTRFSPMELVPPITLRAGDWLLLCSDGLWEMVRDSRIKEIIAKSPSAQTACDLLIREANRNGGEDNITAVAIKFESE